MADGLLGVGALLLAIAYWFWRDGSYWGQIIAWFLAMWGAMCVAWGLITGWYRSVVACVLGAVLAAASAVAGLLWLRTGPWQFSIVCVVGSLAAVAVGGLRARKLLRQRA